MPSSNRYHPCKNPLCPNLANHPSGYCESHLKQRPASETDQRPTATERGYTWEWAQYSISYRKEHPLCIMCLEEGRVTAAQHVDHVIPVTGPDDPLFWDPNNHQPLCASHHSKKTATEDGAFGNKKVTR